MMLRPKPRQFRMAEWPQPKGSLRTSIEGPAGALEILVERPENSAGLMLICHPHPRFGGTLDNKVVYSLARSALATGLTAVRFNFRGVGKSEGVYDEGRGELEDAETVLAYARAQQTGALLLSGFSFGSAVALRLAQRVAADGMISIAPPLSYFDGEAPPLPDCPWLVVHGDEDDVVAWQDTLARIETWSARPQIEIIQGAGHFFHGQLTDLRQRVEPFLRARA